MKQKYKWAQEYCSKILLQVKITEDRNSYIEYPIEFSKRDFIAGFEFAVEKLLEKYDGPFQIYRNDIELLGLDEEEI